jgi:hypothetical protein
MNVKIKLNFGEGAFRGEKTRENGIFDQRGIFRFFFSILKVPHTAKDFRLQRD